MFNFTTNNFEKVIDLLTDITNQADCIVCPRMEYDRISTPLYNSKTPGTDYVRWRTLQLVAETIERRGLKGAIAEAGVWRGAFSYVINNVFPDRKFYLFDTFAGFDTTQIKDEVDSGRIDSYFLDEMNFSDTSIDTVKQFLPHAEKCIFCKGLFEDTCKKVDDSFIFASIDMDLYNPMYHALEYFYPRLVSGGFIFMHDYNHSLVRGIRGVVADYEENHNIMLPIVPLPDSGGTLVVTKNT